MSNQISTFNFKSFPVRIHVLGAEPFFCLLDVASVLGLCNRSVSKFKFNPKGVEKLSTPTTSGVQEMIFINEPNLYRVIFRSNKPEAETFQNWVFEEVLPQIRKTGKYALQNSAEKQPLAQHHQLLIRLYSIANEAHTFVQAINRKGGLGEKIDFDLGCGSYRYNLNMPTKMVLEQVKPILQAQSEQLMQQRAMQSLNNF